MKNIQLSNLAQERVRTYLIKTQGTHYEQEELQKFIDLISPSIREQVAVSIFSKVALRNNRIKRFVKSYLQEKFSGLPKQGKTQQKEQVIHQIVYRMQTDLAEPDRVVIE